MTRRVDFGFFFCEYSAYAHVKKALRNLQPAGRVPNMPDPISQTLLESATARREIFKTWPATRGYYWDSESFILREEGMEKQSKRTI